MAGKQNTEDLLILGVFCFQGYQMIFFKIKTLVIVSVKFLQSAIDMERILEEEKLLILTVQEK